MNRKGFCFLAAGALCFLAAITLIGYNYFDNIRAASSARTNVLLLKETIHTDKAVLPQQEHTLDTSAFEPSSDVLGEKNQKAYLFNTMLEMPTKTIDSVKYVGIITIPRLNLELPVISEWSYIDLRISPCRYYGSAYQDNLVIAAHNYEAHFGTIKELAYGDEIYFEDIDGNVFHYLVGEIEVLSPESTEEMVAGEWDLTLFTCTVGGQNRVTIRASREV